MSDATARTTGGAGATSVRALVRVPASAANLGAGVGCIALAIDRWLTVSARIDARQEPRVRVERAGTLAGLDVPPEHDRIVAGFHAACAVRGREVPHGLHVRASSQIPLARGLGASAAATVAGVLAANTVMRLGLLDDAVVRIAASLEPHAAGVAAAVEGGATLALEALEGVRESLIVRRLEVSTAIVFVVAVPEVAPDAVRAAEPRPDLVPSALAERGAALDAALVRGLLDGDAILLRAALEDAPHTARCRSRVPAFDAVVRAAHEAGALGVAPSGSGPSLLAIAPRALGERVATAMHEAWGREGVRAETILSEARTVGTSVKAQQECEPDGSPARSVASHA